MIEAAMIWNEPNNKSHWDPEIDTDWSKYAELVRLAGAAIAQTRPGLPRVLGGLSPIDPMFVQALEGYGAMDAVDIIALHGFPLDWNLWPIDAWPAKIEEMREVARGKPIWVSEVGVSSFGSEEVQAWGIDRTAGLLGGLAPRIHWYSLFDLPQAWGATTRHREAEGSSYYRHFYMGLIREDGTLKPSYDRFRAHAPAMGLCQWFHFEDPRLDAGVEHLKRLECPYLRTGLSWADWLRPDAERWFDRVMRALEFIPTTVTFCFTPESEGIAPHHTSPPREPERFAAFCSEMLRRYG